jgi:transcriptional regulator with XRE-family HTH domain
MAYVDHGVHPVYVDAQAEKSRGKKRKQKEEPKVVSRLKPNPPYGVNQIRAWRKHRNNMTLEALASRTGFSHATLGRIERGVQPYNQRVLEALVDALQADVPSLLYRDPTDPDGIWSLWDRAKPAERARLVRVAKAIIDEGEAA